MYITHTLPPRPAQRGQHEPAGDGADLHRSSYDII